MALSIKSIEAERFAREIASKTGESLTGAIQKALEERLERLRNQRRSQILASQLDEILRRVDQLPLLDSRTETKSSATTKTGFLAEPTFMVIDTSALVAIFFAEPEREKFLLLSPLREAGWYRRRPCSKLESS